MEISLKELINKLEMMPPNAKILFTGLFELNILRSHKIVDRMKINICYPKKEVYYYHDLENYPDFFHSNGCHQDIILSLCIDDNGYTVENMLSAAKKCIGFTFEGNNGEFNKINANAKIYAAIWGDTSRYRCSNILLNGNIVYNNLTD